MHPLTLTALSFPFVLALAACGTVSGPGSAQSGRATSQAAQAAAPALGTGTLDEEAVRTLRFMREEEKLARDVYGALGRAFEHPTFVHIAGSEQRHMDALGRVIAAYGVDDPIAEDVAGRFADADLQALHDRLVADGSASLTAALTVGALIEETDIQDLDVALADAPPADVAAVYDRLRGASGNHLRAFTGALSGLGVTYAPQVLEADRYAEALTTRAGRGGGGCGRRGGGQGNGACGGACDRPGGGQGNGACGGACAGAGTCDGNCGGGRGAGQGRGQGQGAGNGQGRGSQGR